MVAARTAHLQALELAARRDEEAHQSQGTQESVQERKIEGDQSNAPLNRLQDQSGAKSLENRLQEVQQRVLENARNVESKENSDESLQAVASKNNVDEKSKKLQEIHEVCTYSTN